MGTVLELSSPEFPVRTPGPTGNVLERTGPAAAVSETAWLTATIRPAGTFGRNDTSRLRALLNALSTCASIVVLDLQVARLRSPSAGEVIEDAAWDIEGRGGCLLCINVDSESRTCLSAAGDHAVLIDDPSQLVAPRITSGPRPGDRDVTHLELVSGTPQSQLNASDMGNSLERPHRGREHHDQEHQTQLTRLPEPRQLPAAYPPGQVSEASGVNAHCTGRFSTNLDGLL